MPLVLVSVTVTLPLRLSLQLRVSTLPDLVTWTALSETSTVQSERTPLVSVRESVYLPFSKERLCSVPSAKLGMVLYFSMKETMVSYTWRTSGWWPSWQMQFRMHSS